MRRTISWGLAVLALALLTAGACDRGQKRSDETEDTPAESNGGDEESNAGETSGLLESEGEDCSRDPDCSGYLRCLEGTCTIPPAVEGRHDADTPVVTLSPPDDAATADGGDGSEDAEEAESVEFYVELAKTAAERRRGLMYRERLADGWGMLFVYPRDAPRSFWMKNTYIPLDMVFIDTRGNVVSIIESAEPQTLTARRSEGPARFVLELNAGVAAESGIAPGWQMSVDNIPDAYSPER